MKIHELHISFLYNKSTVLKLFFITEHLNHVKNIRSFKKPKILNKAGVMFLKY